MLPKNILNKKLGILKLFVFLPPESKKEKKEKVCI